MTEQTNLVPKRRFKEFQNTPAWEQQKLGEVLDLLKDGTHGTHKDVEDGVYLLSAKNIKNGEISTDESDRKISIAEYNKIHKKFHLEKGDVLLTIVGSIGESAIIDNPNGITFQRSVAYLRPKDEVTSQFLFTTINTGNFQRELKNRQAVSAQPGIYLGDLAAISIQLPSNDEQSKIGEFFNKLDSLITLHQRKLEKTKTLKSAYLSEMFPAESEREPKRRFAGFTGAWEQRKLKEFGKATSGTSIESEFVEGGKYKVISIGSYSEQSVYTDQNIRANLTEKTKSRILNKDDLTMILNDKTASGNIIGRVLLIDSSDSYVYNQRTERIEPNHETFDSRFLYQLLNAPMIRSKIMKQAQGNTQIYVNWSAIGELDYLVPERAEQIKIGVFFKNFDHLITLHQRKLEKLKNIKKAYLNEMFI